MSKEPYMPSKIYWTMPKRSNLQIAQYQETVWMPQAALWRQTKGGLTRLAFFSV